MSMVNKSVGITQDRAMVRCCVECGAKIPKAQKVCPACGEVQT